MNRNMKSRYRAFRRGWGTYYCEDLVTKKQESLKTQDKEEAFRLVAARNETEATPAFSRQLARVYWTAGDSAAASRTWEHIMDEIPKTKEGSTRQRWLMHYASAIAPGLLRSYPPRKQSDDMRSGIQLTLPR